MVLRKFLFFKAANLNQEKHNKKLSDLEKSILIPFLEDEWNKLKIFAKALLSTGCL